MNLMTIDPGLSGTGWAIWPPKPVRAIVNGHRPTPIVTGSIFSRGRGKDIVLRAESIAHTLMSLAVQHKVAMAVLEFPEFHGSVGGMMVAKRGDLVKLTFLTGFLSGFLRARMQVKLIKVHTWKGQLPKTVVQSRVRNILGSEATENLKNDHEWDAVGIGLFVQGYMP